MKTSALIDLLANQTAPPDRRALTKALAWPVVVGLLVSLALSAGLIGLLPMSQFALPPIWVKFAYGLALAATVSLLLSRLCRPGTPTSDVVKWPLIPVMTLTLLGLVHLMLIPQSLWAPAIFAGTWLVCPWMVLALSLPALLGLLYAIRSLAPTDLRATGFAAGLLAGAVGALAYSFVCPETSLTFVAIWYTAGIVLAGFVGRALGPWVLRW